MKILTDMNISPSWVDVFTHNPDFGDALATTEAKTPSAIQVRLEDTMKRFSTQLKQEALITIACDIN